MGNVRRTRRSAAFAVALAVLLACANADHASDAKESKITPSPGLVEAVANGDMTMPSAFTATPVDASPDMIDASTSGTSSNSATTPTSSSSTTDATTTPRLTPAALTPRSSSSAIISPGETAVDTFQSTNGIANTNTSGSSGTILGLLAGVGGVGAIVVAVLYKRKQAQRRNSDDKQDAHQQQQQQAQHSTAQCAFENADYTPGRDSTDVVMLQDSRLLHNGGGGGSGNESIAMMPIFSAADRMDMVGGIVRLSSPFGVTSGTARISSPGQCGARSTADDMAFNVDPNSQRSNNAFAVPSADAAAPPHTIVHVKPEAWL